MRTIHLTIIVLLLTPQLTLAAKQNVISVIAKEPVTMMDLGLLKLNSVLQSRAYAGLKDATIGANYNKKRGTIDIKVSKPVTKASRTQCKKTINAAKDIFIKGKGKKKKSNLYHYFQHEGRAYKRKMNWDDLDHYVVITGIVLTKKNYQHSIYCQSKLLKKKVTY